MADEDKNKAEKLAAAKKRVCHDGLGEFVNELTRAVTVRAAQERQEGWHEEEG